MTEVMPPKKTLNPTALRIIMLLTFGLGYLAGCLFPALKVPMTGISIPAWLAALVCYAALAAGAGFVAFVAAWFVTRVGLFVIKRAELWDAFIDFYSERVNRAEAGRDATDGTATREG